VDTEVGVEVAVMVEAAVAVGAVAPDPSL